jgi:hypothetical protein
VYQGDNVLLDLAFLDWCSISKKYKTAFLKGILNLDKKRILRVGILLRCHTLGLNAKIRRNWAVEDRFNNTVDMGFKREEGIKIKSKF